MGNVVENFRRKYNILNCNIKDLDFILYQLRVNSKTDCNEELLPIVQRLFKYNYTTDNLSRRGYQKNYCMLALASITAKLTANSQDYDYMTNRGIANMLLGLRKYWERIQSLTEEDEKEMASAVYCVSGLDGIIDVGEYNNPEKLASLTTIAYLLMENQIKSLEFKGDYNVNQEKIDKIAGAPELIEALDIFGIQVAHNESGLVRDIVVENFANTYDVDRERTR